MFPPFVVFFSDDDGARAFVRTVRFDGESKTAPAVRSFLLLIRARPRKNDLPVVVLRAVTLSRDVLAVVMLIIIIIIIAACRHFLPFPFRESEFWYKGRGAFDDFSNEFSVPFVHIMAI